jgi:hypothetical protein
VNQFARAIGRRRAMLLVRGVGCSSQLLVGISVIAIISSRDETQHDCSQPARRVPAGREEMVITFGLDVLRRTLNKQHATGRRQ